MLTNRLFPPRHRHKTFLLGTICCIIFLELRFSLINSYVSIRNKEALSHVSFELNPHFKSKSEHLPLLQVMENQRKQNPDETETENESVQLDWQPVPGSNYKFSVYSAYSYDRKEVVIIATTKTFTEEAVTCVFHFGKLQRSIIGSVETMDEHWKLKYAGTFIRCPLPILSNSTLPHSVSITSNSKNRVQSQNEGNLLKIQYKSMDQLTNPSSNFSICVLPAYKYNDVFHFLEWLEFNKLMGVRHFTFYNVSFGPSISCVLKNLMKNSGEEGARVNVHPWHKFPINSPMEIRASACGECGLSPAINDCIYRHKGLSKYLAIVDFDEFIMPRSAEDFGEMIKSLDVLNKSVKIGEYSFRNGFFPRPLASDELTENICEELKLARDPFAYHVCKQLLMVKKSSREETIHTHGVRSKYIVKPEAVREGGNHHVIKLERGYETLVAPQEVAMLRHYRSFDRFWRLPDNAGVVPDRISKSFALTLAKKVAKQVIRFRELCRLRVNQYRFWTR